MQYIFVRELTLPYSVKGFTVKDENGDFNIYINEHLSLDGKKSAYKHELAHVCMNHFDSDAFYSAECEEEISIYMSKNEKSYKHMPGKDGL